jgi:hypothetical protein
MLSGQLPTRLLHETKTEPGSVIYLKATPVSDDMLRVDNLRSQGIEVVGGTARKDFMELYNNLGNMTAEKRYDYLRQAQQEGYIFNGRALLEAGIYAVANELVTGYQGSRGCEDALLTNSTSRLPMPSTSTCI